MVNPEHTNALIFVVVATLGLLLLTTFCLWFLFAYQKRQFRHQREISRIRQTYDHEILKTELEIKEQTLRSISQEIHDNVGQVLSLAKLMLSSLDLEAASPVSEKVDNVMRLMSRGMNDLRNLSKTMDANTLTTEGLAEAIRCEADLLGRTDRYTIDFRLTGVEERLDPSVELIMYRIAQELLNNVIRHASASCIVLDLQYATRYVCLVIQDDGTGFQSAPDQAGNGAGLRNMRNRASLIGADLTIDSAPQRGTLARLTVPLVSPPTRHR